MSADLDALRARLTAVSVRRPQQPARRAPEYPEGWVMPRLFADLDGCERERVPTVGERLRLWRRMRGMSQSAVAAVIGVKRTVVSDYESGTRAPSAERLAAIAAALGVSL